jgi:hypothetical protein
MENINLTEEEIKQIKLLRASNIMYEKTKQKTLEMNKPNKNDVIDMLNKAQEDIIKQAEQHDITLEAIKPEFPLNEEIKNSKIDLFEIKVDAQDEDLEEISFDSQENQVLPIISDSDSNTQYDVISLPSNGECYKSKQKSVAVSFLTAYDENLITSPNLYKDGLIIDFLLKHKVIDKKIDVDKLCVGDSDAIILWLRATGYGNEFPVIVTDPITDKQFEAIIDLTTIKTKPFTLKGDENGYFSFTTPNNKDLIKFRFLTRGDEKKLEKLNKYENIGVKKQLILSNLNDIIQILATDVELDGLTHEDRNKITDNLYTWANSVNENKKSTISKLITNRLEMSIVSINGNEDKKYIKEYIKKMPARDSLELRRYMLENEPGMDFEVEVQRPVSLGGGSFKTFLPWDDTVFYHIS